MENGKNKNKNKNKKLFEENEWKKIKKNLVNCTSRENLATVFTTRIEEKICRIIFHKCLNPSI